MHHPVSQEGRGYAMREGEGTENGNREGASRPLDRVGASLSGWTDGPDLGIDKKSQDMRERDLMDLDHNLYVQGYDLYSLVIPGE